MSMVGTAVVYTERQCADTTTAQCRFPGLAISNAKIRIYFSDKVYGSYSIKQHSQKLLWFEISKMLFAVLKTKFILSFVIISGTLSFPV